MGWEEWGGGRGGRGGPGREGELRYFYYCYQSCPDYYFYLKVSVVEIIIFKGTFKGSIGFRV